MDGAGDGRWVTFTELAAAREISKASASKLVRRHGWRRQKNNRGTVRILVPSGSDRRSDHRPPDRPSDSPPFSLADSLTDNTSLVRTLQDAVALLREQLAQAEQRAVRAEARADQAESELHSERTATHHLAKQISGLSADLARLAATPGGQVRDSSAELAESTWIARLHRWMSGRLSGN
jgi:hypothetical protein